MISKPLQVKVIKPYVIWLKYADETEGSIDLSHLLNKPVFKNWANLSFFNAVNIDSDTWAVAWNENIELCPDNLYLKIKGITFEQWKSNQDVYAT